VKIAILILLLFLIANTAVAQTETSSEDNFTLTAMVKNPVRLAREKDRYHSLDFSLSAKWNPDSDKQPKEIEFTLISVVKAKKLNSDLYVVFVVDGKELHFGSNRSAIKRPVPGRTWIGERMVFQIPFDDYLKLVAAEKLALKMGDIVFDFDERARAEVRGFVKAVRRPDN